MRRRNRRRRTGQDRTGHPHEGVNVNAPATAQCRAKDSTALRHLIEGTAKACAEARTPASSPQALNTTLLHPRR
eukprot:2258159-Pyramimonas_sp.AAC.1